MIFSLNLVVCDFCTNPGPVGDDVRDARRQAAEQGWTTVHADSDVQITQDRCPRHPAAETFRELFDRSSLGTPEAKAAIASVPPDRAQAIVDVAAQLRGATDPASRWRIRLSDHDATVPAWRFDSREEAQALIDSVHLMMSPRQRLEDARWRDPVPFQELGNQQEDSRG